MQSESGSSTWRIGTVKVVIRQNLLFPVDCPFVDRIGQKLSAAAPTTDVVALGIAPDFPISIQDNFRIFRLSFYAFFWP